MSNSINCPLCKAEYTIEPSICNKCKYPFSGTDSEKSKFVAQQIMNRGKIDDAMDAVKKTRIILFVIGAINISLVFFRYRDLFNASTLIGIDVFIGLIFITFGLTAKKYPLISILVPFLLLISIYTLQYMIHPSYLAMGILWKVLFIFSMVYSIASIIQSEKIKKQSAYLAEENQ